MKNLIRGGQTSVHSFHMSAQLVVTLIKVAVFIVVLGNLFYVFGKFDLQDFKEIAMYYVAEFFVALGSENVHLHFTGRYGNLYDLKVSVIVANTAVIAKKNQIISAIISGLLYGIFYAFCTMVFLLILFNYRGKKLAKEKFIRGAKIVPKWRLRKIIQKYNHIESIKNRQLFPSNFYKIAKIPFPENAEFLHTLVLGSTGTGKTNTTLELLDQIRRRGDRAIIYDKMGIYTSTYYDPSRDIILNPLDARSPSWSFFKEIRNESDYDYMASAFIQEKGVNGDKFWTDAARRVFAVFAKKLNEEKGSDVTNTEFVDALLKANYEELSDFMEGTEASLLVSKKSDKTAISILSVIATHISSMKYLRDSENYFSIRDWIKNDSDGLLFISSRGDQHDSLQPLISTWIDIAIKALLSVEQNSQNNSNPRRIWIILDEIPSLQKMPSLLDGLSQSRQFGGAFILGLHSISQLRAVYGKDNTETITSLCRNKLFFAAADPDTAEYCSENLGSQEIEEVKEGVSYGANQVRDGVNLNKQKSNKRIVIASELMNMRKLSAYIKFAGEFPVSKISFKIKNRPKVAERFVDMLPIVVDSNLTESTEEKSDDVNDFNEVQIPEQLSLFDKQETSVSEEELEEESDEDEEYDDEDAEELEQEELEEEDNSNEDSDSEDMEEEENKDSDTEQSQANKEATTEVSIPRKIKFRY